MFRTAYLFIIRRQLLYMQRVIYHASKFVLYNLCCCLIFVLYLIFVLFYVLFVLCRSLYCLCVYVYCTTATGWLPNCVKYISYHIYVD
jgi:hypothetical protein